PASPAAPRLGVTRKEILYASVTVLSTKILGKFEKFSRAVLCAPLQKPRVQTVSRETVSPKIPSAVNCLI
ncbi:MAG: hypothetical protein Q4C41_01235, partial [Eggerthellaceae bacterium]|nr:hypothetical protein [Eggerthellaceae bacterium]